MKPQVLSAYLTWLFISLVFELCGHVLSLMVECPNDFLLVLQCLVWGIEQVPSVCGFPVNFDVKASIKINSKLYILSISIVQHYDKLWPKWLRVSIDKNNLLFKSSYLVNEKTLKQSSI